MRTQRLTGMLAILVLGLARPVAAQQPTSPGLPPDAEAVGRCEFVSPDEGPAAEKTLAGSPDDLNSHLILVGCYFGDDERRTDWVKHLFWLIDHHPESIVFVCCGLPQVYLADTERGWFPSPELANQYIKHWEQAVAAHQRDPAVLSHAALSFGTIDPNLGLPPARKALELDPACKGCREILGSMYGLAILRIRPPRCVPRTPDAEQHVATLRKEIALLSDPAVRRAAGSTMKGYSEFYQERCGGNAEEAVGFGEKLLDSKGP